MFKALFSNVDADWVISLSELVKINYYSQNVRIFRQYAPSDGAIRLLRLDFILFSRQGALYRLLFFFTVFGGFPLPLLADFPLSPRIMPPFFLKLPFLLLKF